jgi:hypothetical protein
MNRKLILSLLIVVVCGNVFAQEVKLRVGANYGTFNKEIGPEEVPHPYINVISPDKYGVDFSSDSKMGFETELMLLWTPNIETGIEFRYSNFSGFSDTIPSYYNFLLSDDWPDNERYNNTPLIYESSAMSFLFNFRYYLAPGGNINPFFKAFGGISLVGAELNYKDRSVWEDGEAGVLYSAGTQNSDNPRESAFQYGAGIGINFKFSDRVSLYLDGSASAINSGTINGIPNYDYITADQTLKPVDGKSMIYTFSVGLVFDTGANLGLSKNTGGTSGKGSKTKGTGNTSPYRPFYRKR